MHRPKIPQDPKIFRNYQARPWQSSKKSWDSWESWACAWILHFVHQESWESWACAGFVTSKMEKAHQTCTGPRFPRFLMNIVQDSCTGPRFPRIPRFFGTLSGSCLIVPKNLGILGNLGPVHESCTLFIRNLGDLGPVQVLFPSVIKKTLLLLQYLYGRKRWHFRNIIGDNVPNSFLTRKIRSSQWTYCRETIKKGVVKKSEHSLRWLIIKGK